MATKKSKLKKKDKPLWQRIFNFRSTEERLRFSGIAEHLDIPPGSHHFVCDGHARVIFYHGKDMPRTTFVFKEGRWRIVIPGDVLVTVQCADDVNWQFDLSMAAEVVDQTRIEVPMEQQAANKAHTDLRYMIDRFMRGTAIYRPRPEEPEKDGDADDFNIDDHHPYSKYEQRVIDEDRKAQERLEKTAPPPPVDPPKAVGEKPKVEATGSVEVK